MNVFIHLIFKVEYKWEFSDSGWPKLVRKYTKRYWFPFFIILSLYGKIIYTMGTNIICVLIGFMIGSLFVTFTSPKSDGESNETL